MGILKLPIKENHKIFYYSIVIFMNYIKLDPQWNKVAVCGTKMWPEVQNSKWTFVLGKGIITCCRPPFTATDPMKVYNIILRGFDQLDFPRHVSRSENT
jgi:hypothetical protein